MKMPIFNSCLYKNQPFASESPEILTLCKQTKLPATLKTLKSQMSAAFKDFILLKSKDFPITEMEMEQLQPPNNFSHYDSRKIFLEVHSKHRRQAENIKVPFVSILDVIKIWLSSPDLFSQILTTNQKYTLPYLSTQVTITDSLIGHIAYIYEKK